MTNRSCPALTLEPCWNNVGHPSLRKPATRARIVTWFSATVVPIAETLIGTSRRSACTTVTTGGGGTRSASVRRWQPAATAATNEAARRTATGRDDRGRIMLIGRVPGPGQRPHLGSLSIPKGRFLISIEIAAENREPAMGSFGW